MRQQEKKLAKIRIPSRKSMHTKPKVGVKNLSIYPPTWYWQPSLHIRIGRGDPMQARGDPESDYVMCYGRSDHGPNRAKFQSWF